MQKPKPIWEQRAAQLQSEADTAADSFLDKLKASKWTAWILGAVAAAVLFILLVKIL